MYLAVYAELSAEITLSLSLFYLTEGSYLSSVALAWREKLHVIFLLSWSEMPVVSLTLGAHVSTSGTTETRDAAWQINLI
jgi:hypothetical protein